MVLAESLARLALDLIRCATGVFGLGWLITPRRF